MRNGESDEGPHGYLVTLPRSGTILGSPMASASHSCRQRMECSMLTPLSELTTARRRSREYSLGPVLSTASPDAPHPRPGCQRGVRSRSPGVPGVRSVHVTTVLPALCWALAVALACGPVSASVAAGVPYLAAVVVDADTGRVLHAENANRRLRPASLTKLMTALLVMEHLDAGAHPDDTWSVSGRAAGQPASRLGLRPGRSLSVDSVLDALLVASANDAAVVAAEGVAGSESVFVSRMNAAAARLGLTRTRFGNASGLPGAQYTTARDMAALARHLWQRFPAQRPRYARPGITHAGRWVGSTNRLIGSYPGAMGMKTGFTCRAGFNMVAAARRDGRTLIAVVLGASTRQGRDGAVRRLLDRGFARKATDGAITLDALATTGGQGDALPVSASIIARACLVPRGPSGWNIDLGVARSEKEALDRARAFIREHRKGLRAARAVSIPRYMGVALHRVIVTGLDRARAQRVCLDFRKQGGHCIIFGPDAAARQLEEAARIRAMAEAYLESASQGVSPPPVPD